MTTPHHPASQWGCPFGSLAKAKVGEKRFLANVNVGHGEARSEGVQNYIQGTGWSVGVLTVIPPPDAFIHS